jgi:hypothetical protein
MFRSTQCLPNSRVDHADIEYADRVDDVDVIVKMCLLFCDLRVHRQLAVLRVCQNKHYVMKNLECEPGKIV